MAKWALTLVLGVVIICAAGCSTSGFSDNESGISETAPFGDTAADISGDDAADWQKHTDGVHTSAAYPPPHIEGDVEVTAIRFGTEVIEVESASGTETWRLTVSDVVVVPAYSPGHPACLAVLGHAELLHLESGLTSSGYSFPNVQLVQNGAVAVDEYCETQNLTSQKYRAVLGLRITEGTESKWFRTFAATQDEYDFVTVGGHVFADSDRAVIGQVIQPDIEPVDTTKRYRFGQAHSHGAGSSGELWTVQVDEVAAIESLDGSGGCIAVMGEATLNWLRDSVVSNGFGFPQVTVTQNGVALTETVCEASGLESAGYRSALMAEVTQGTTFKWYRTFESELGTKNQDKADFGAVAVGEIVYERD